MLNPTLANNGGPTFTHALVAASAAINAGNPAAPGSVDAACALLDQRGLTRPDRCDIGAYEFGGVSPNRPPTATADGYSLAEDKTLAVSVIGGVLHNDSDPDNDALTAVLVSNPSHAQSFQLNADGSFSYTPVANYNGTDSFTYKARDPSGAESSTVAVTLTITAVNDPPTAVGDGYSTAEDTTLAVPAPGILSNDGDVDGDPLTAVLVSAPTHYSVFGFNSNGSFSYTPVSNYNGPDSFTYKVRDPSGAESSTVTVLLTVTPVNDPPTGTNDGYSTDEDTTLTVPAPGLLANDHDVDGDTLVLQFPTSPLHAASFTISADGSFSYTPAANYHGPDSFTYRVSDGHGGLSDPVTVSITVNSVNDAPTATGDGYTTDEDTALNMASPGVLGNDGDVDGDALRRCS